jgi:hypothetical protein
MCKKCYMVFFWDVRAITSPNYVKVSVCHECANMAWRMGQREWDIHIWRWHWLMRLCKNPKRFMTYVFPQFFILFLCLNVFFLWNSSIETCWSAVFENTSKLHLSSTSIAASYFISIGFHLLQTIPDKPVCSPAIHLAQFITGTINRGTIHLAKFTANNLPSKIHRA